MARNGYAGAQTFICTILVLLLTNVQTEKYCLKGLNTLGYTEPHGDIYIEHGDPLNITCVLNDEYVQQHGNNSSKDLYFLKDANIIPSEMVEILNSSSIRLHILEPPLSSSVYTCKSKDGTRTVCLNNVVVGTKPLPVNDFDCISSNYENLTCTWTTPENYVKTDYTLTYSFPGRAGRYMLNTCPKQTFDRENQKMSCLWTILSNPQYRQAQRTFYFHLIITNMFGTTIINNTFSHFQHVLSGPPENLTCVNVTSKSIYLDWSIPNAMQVFPPGLRHRIMYQSEHGEKVWEFGGMIETTGDQMKRHVSYNLTGLKYAHALYDIRISMRSMAVESPDEIMWSKNASITVRTSSKIPGAPPRTNIGSFEIVSSVEYNVYVYWQQIDEKIKNGDNFRYYVTMEGSNIKPNHTTNTYAVFKNLHFDSNYTFHIWSQNSVGLSEKKSTIFVPSSLTRVKGPTRFVKVAYSDGKYELSWDVPAQNNPNEKVKNYTIFWCTHDRDRPYQCLGFLNWTEIPSNLTSYSITVSDDTINQFAISANSETSSSGMMWATCTVLHNQPIGKMDDVSITVRGATSATVSWKLNCIDHRGTIKGFVVYYCLLVEPENRICKGPEQNVTVFGDSSLNETLITGLKPYSTYIFAVSVLNTYGTQSQKSDFKAATMMEAAPSSPRNVGAEYVTNSTIKVVWEIPEFLNGKLRYYNVLYSNGSAFSNVVKSENLYCELNNLVSFVNYTISVEACTSLCSKPSASVTFRTMGGYPSKISQPGVVFQNDSYIVVEWGQPLYPRGRNDVYEVNIKERLQYENKTSAVVNVTGNRYIIEDCSTDRKHSSFYISVRAVNIFNGIRYEGPWSDELESYCSVLPNLWLWTLIPVCIFILLGLFYMAKKIYLHCQEMRDVEVKLPSGLAPVTAIDIGLSHWGGSKIQEEQDHHPSADEELLLMKLGSQNFSGDSSGCSSGHESVTSSLESGTHLSSTSDSGTEQPRSTSMEDLHKNSLRLRNVSSRPSLGKGYITMPTEAVNTSAAWNSKNAAPESYCVLGVDPTLTTNSPTYVPVSVFQLDSAKLPYILPDTSTPPSPYAVTGELNKFINPGYIPLNASETTEKSPAYVMAGGKSAIVPDLMRLDSVRSTDLEEKPAYVQVADVGNSTRKITPDNYTQHQPSIEVSPLKVGYVSIGDIPGPRSCIDTTKGYIPHRHFDAKTLKED